MFLAVATFRKLTTSIHTKSRTRLYVSITSVMKLVFIKVSNKLNVLKEVRLYTFPKSSF